MKQRLALLCSGQGGQHLRMFERTQPQKKILNEQLFVNRYAQPLIVEATLGNWEALKNKLPEPDLVLGYSIGELTAYAVAGAIQPEEAIQLAVKRAEWMDKCPQGGLLALSGCPKALLKDYPVEIAIDNGHGHYVVGGLTPDLASLESALKKKEIKATRLPVEVASHTSWMAPASHAFVRELEKTSFRTPRFPILSTITGELVTTKEKMVALLSRQISETIHWADCYPILKEKGVAIALELGPGAQLSRMMRKAYFGLACRSVEEFRSFEGVISWINRRFFC